MIYAAEWSTASISRLVVDMNHLAESWEVRPLLSRGLSGMDHIISLEIIADAVQNRGLRVPFISMLRDGRRVGESAFTYDRCSGPNQIDGVIDPIGIRECLQDGATLVAQGLSWYLPTVRKFCERLSAELGHYISANAYLTPPRSRGGGLHYDFHSVFIRQVWGKKFWSVREPLQQWPKAPCAVGDNVTTAIVLETWLNPGDCLYLPRGYVHDGWTDEQPSLHLTCGMRDPITWADIIVGELCERALEESLELRSIPPLRFSESPDALVSEAVRKLEAIESVLTRMKADDIAAAALRRTGPDGWPRRLQPAFSVFDWLQT